MRKVYIRGLVATADGIRRQLAEPVSPERLSEVRQRVADALRTVDEIVREAGTSTAALPAPSRKAYQYLSDLDLESVETTAIGQQEPHLPDSVRFHRLRSCFDGLLNRLANLDDPSVLFEFIQRTRDGLDQHMREQSIKPEHLTPESRNIWAWLGYFSVREHFDAYRAALQEAQPLMDDAARASARFSAPVLIHFRPMKGLCRVRGRSDSTALHLPTPMITFDADGFGALARLVFTDMSIKQAVVELTRSQPYGSVREEINRLAEGVQGRGAFHDLGASFDRVNAEYFGSQIARLRLTWNRQITGRMFGHYDPANDTVMVSSTLDSTEVPELVVDFVIYHELLHKKLGVISDNGRRAAHTPEFRREERRFRRFTEAEAELKRLAKRYS